MNESGEALEPFARQAGEGEALWWLGSLAIIKAAREETGGRFTLVEVAENEGETPLHVHHREDETFFVLEGEIDFEVDGKRLIDGPCRVFPMGKDQYTLNTWDGGKPRQSHFAVVTTQSDGRTIATWNKDPDDSRAYDPLGVVTKRDGCWVNARTRICAQ